MRTWTPEQVARAAGARLVAPPPSATGPERAVIDSRQAGPGALFVGLRGEHDDGGRFAPQALAAGAWGVLTTPEHAEAARCAVPGALIAAEDPLRALQRLATVWRHELDAKVIGVTGSTGKTSTKDLLLALLSPHRRTVASRANYNTEIGVPLEILAAPPGTEVLVLEMAMRGAGQIAELAAIAEPDVGRDRQRRTRPPRVPGHDRGDRRRQGRADRGARARRDRDPPRPRATARTAPAGRRRDDHVRGGGRRATPALGRAPRRDRSARPAGRARGAVHAGASAPQPPARGGRRGRGRREP